MHHFFTKLSEWKNALMKTFIEPKSLMRPSVQGRAGLDQTQAIKGWLLLPFPTDTRISRGHSAVPCLLPWFARSGRELDFSVKLGEQHRQMAKWQSLHTREDKSFLRADLAKNTDIRQPKLWEISCCIYTSRWIFRRSWQQRKKAKQRKKLTKEAAKEVFWNLQCSWGVKKEEMLKQTRQKTEIIIP